MLNNIFNLNNAKREHMPIYFLVLLILQSYKLTEEEKDEHVLPRPMDDFYNGGENYTLQPPRTLMKYQIYPCVLLARLKITYSLKWC